MQSVLGFPSVFIRVSGESIFLISTASTFLATLLTQKFSADFLLVNTHNSQKIPAMPTNRNYEDAARAALNFATKAGSQNVAPLLPTRELRERMEKGERVVLVPGRLIWTFVFNTDFLAKGLSASIDHVIKKFKFKFL